jgi:predicted MFS family arabinose efflux permease
VTALLRTPEFWLTSFGAALALATSQAVVHSLVPMGTEHGLPILKATSLLSVFGAGAIIGGLVFALVLADKIDKIVLLSGLFLLGVLVNALLLSAKSYTILAISAAMLGVSGGTATHTFYALLADRFGMRLFGTARGMSLLLIAAVSMIGMRASGELFDRTGGYDAAFGLFIAINFVAAMMMLASRYSRRLASGSV